MAGRARLLGSRGTGGLSGRSHRRERHFECRAVGHPRILPTLPGRPSADSCCLRIGVPNFPVGIPGTPAPSTLRGTRGRGGPGSGPGTGGGHARGILTLPCRGPRLGGVPGPARAAAPPPPAPPASVASPPSVPPAPLLLGCSALEPQPTSLSALDAGRESRVTTPVAAPPPPPWSAAYSQRGRSTSSPVMASHRRDRLDAARPDGSPALPILERPELRAATQNVEPGTPVVPSSAASCSFSALESIPLGHLAKVATDSAIVFRGKFAPP